MEAPQERRGGETEPPPRPESCQDAPAPASAIFATASSIVKLPGRWIGGKSLNVAANIAAPVWAA